MDYDQALDSIVSDLKQKYSYLTELLEITKEMGRVSLEDTNAVSALIDKRQGIMYEANKLDDKIINIVSNMPEVQREKIKVCLRDGEIVFTNQKEAEISGAHKHNKELLNVIIAEDEKMNERMKQHVRENE